ncbi:MAG: hypothetical protein PWQ41_784 [Bacillota bacterium]|jgi:sporulation integral membrane protein YtvI|nr:hypothetical protein [Bacillota bacterium]MDK2855522.1 hypothetical protein [Bacillota bacterium]MDK2925010.1 hypothetical protein [Bacillota bacterium]
MNRTNKLVLAAVGFLLVLYLGLRYLLPLVLPFVLGAFLAVVLDPAVSFLQRRVRLPRAWAAAITLLGAMSLFGGSAFYLTLHVAADIADLSRQLPVYSSGMIKTIQELAAETQDFYLHLPEPLLKMAEEVVLWLYDLAGVALKSLLAALSSVPEILVVFILSCVAAYFLSRDKAALFSLTLKLLPPGSEERLRTLEREVVNNLVGLLWAELLLVVITTLTAILGLWLLGIRYAVFLGLLSGLLDVLPVVGPTLLFIPWIAVAFVTGQKVLALGLIAVYVAMNIVRQVLQGKVIGEKTGLHPLLVLVSLYLGVKLFGANGLIIGPLTLIVLKALLKAGAFGNFIQM